MYAIGTRVKIINGMQAGHNGTIDSTDEDNPTSYGVMMDELGLSPGMYDEDELELIDTDGPECTCDADPDSHCKIHGMTRPAMNWIQL